MGDGIALQPHVAYAYAALGKQINNLPRILERAGWGRAGVDRDMVRVVLYYLPSLVIRVVLLCFRFCMAQRQRWCVTECGLSCTLV